MDSKSESHTRFRFRYLWIRIGFRLKSTRFRLQIRFHYTWFRIRNQIRIRIQIRPLIPTPDSESPQVWFKVVVNSSDSRWCLPADSDIQWCLPANSDIQWCIPANSDIHWCLPADSIVFPFIGDVGLFGLRYNTDTCFAHNFNVDKNGGDTFRTRRVRIQPMSTSFVSGVRKLCPRPRAIADWRWVMNYSRARNLFLGYGNCALNERLTTQQRIVTRILLDISRCPHRQVVSKFSCPARYFYLPRDVGTCLSLSPDIFASWLTHHRHYILCNKYCIIIVYWQLSEDGEHMFCQFGDKVQILQVQSGQNLYGIGQVGMLSSGSWVH